MRQGTIAETPYRPRPKSAYSRRSRARPYLPVLGLLGGQLAASIAVLGR
ncbi:hypothetical protein H6F43_15170 [Leptolyngbya sp. FACHB-36]|nr:hypothetical protein [Leptolyngbya sp. FACHB-36]MBD2021519.1 hypothetical protein [Leptolyngbya sp. FACHB-36]